MDVKIGTVAIMMYYKKVHLNFCSTLLYLKVTSLCMVNFIVGQFPLNIDIRIEQLVCKGNK